MWNVMLVLIIIIGSAALCIALYIYNSKPPTARPNARASTYVAYDPKVLKITPVKLRGFVSFYVECSYVREDREYFAKSRQINIVRVPFLNPSPDIECGVTVFVDEADPANYYVEVRTRLK